MRIGILLLLILQAYADCDCDGDSYCKNGVCDSCTDFRYILWESTPDWGEVTGTSGINGYSNKDDPNVPNASLYEYINPGEYGFEEKILIGQKYQCVHFARHYWLIQNQTGFGNVDTADQIFNLTTARNYSSGADVNLHSYQNGKTSEYPRIGDLLIYKKDGTDYPAGHVAVVVKVDKIKNILYIAEQNYDIFWDNQNYSRALVIDRTDNITSIVNKRYLETNITKCRDYNGAEEAEILGWVSVYNFSKLLGFIVFLII